MKEDNKLKKFVKKHELAFAIVGGAVIIVAGAGLMYLGFRSISNTKIKDLKYLVGKDKDVNTLLEVAKTLDKGTRGHLIETWTEPTTVAVFFGECAEEFMKNSTLKIQPDDIVTSAIYSIAKKAET